MKSREKESYIKAYRSTYQFLNDRGHRSDCQRLDNETSEALETYFKEEAKVNFQYLSASSHRRNKVKRAIRTFKNQFIATMASAKSTFPLYLWDETIPQINICINLLRQFSDDLTISAYQGIFGQPYNFMAHPMAPIGTAVLVYRTPAERASWSDHGSEWFYLGPAIDSYRNFRVFITI